MSRTPTSVGAAFLFSLGMFFSTATAASAQVVNLPPTMQIQGLTLEGPLSLDMNQPKSPAFISSVHFNLTPALLLSGQPASSSADLADLIESPSNEATVSAVVNLPEKVKPTLAPSATPAPTTTPTAAPTSTPSAAPEAASIPTNTSSGLDASALFSMVQNYRQASNLPPFQVDQRACEVAQARAPQVEEEIDDGHMHSGLQAMNLPYWNSENIITMRTDQEAFNWWINDPIHHAAIVGDYKYSCLACSGNACAEEFTNFASK